MRTHRVSGTRGKFFGKATSSVLARFEPTARYFWLLFGVFGVAGDCKPQWKTVEFFRIVREVSHREELTFFFGAAFLPEPGAFFFFFGGDFSAACRAASVL